MAAGKTLLFRLQLLWISPTLAPPCFFTFYPKAGVAFTQETAAVAFKDITAVWTLSSICLVVFGVAFVSKDVQQRQP